MRTALLALLSLALLSSCTGRYVVVRPSEVAGLTQSHWNIVSQPQKQNDGKK